MSAVLLQILVERHWLFNHLLVQHRGIEQMQTVGLPYGKAEVGDIESRLLTGDGYDVAIIDDLTEQGAVLNGSFGDITEALTCDGLLHLTDGRHIFRMCAKRLITFRMTAHIVHIHLLDG